MKRLLSGFVLSFILLFIGCGGGASSPVVSSPQLVFSINGTGDSYPSLLSTKETKAFHISRGEWYIETTCDALEPNRPVSFLVSVFPKDKPVESNNYVSIISQSTTGTAVNYVHVAGDFYLYIVSVNIKDWSVKVYQ